MNSEKQKEEKVDLAALENKEMYKSCLEAMKSKDESDLLTAISIVANSDIQFRQGQCRNMLHFVANKFWSWRHPNFFPKNQYNRIYSLIEIHLGTNRKPTYRDRLKAYCKAIFQIVTEQEE